MILQDSPGVLSDSLGGEDPQWINKLLPILDRRRRLGAQWDQAPDAEGTVTKEGGGHMTDHRSFISSSGDNRSSKMSLNRLKAKLVPLHDIVT